MIALNNSMIHIIKQYVSEHKFQQHLKQIILNQLKNSWIWWTTKHLLNMFPMVKINLENTKCVPRILRDMQNMFSKIKSWDKNSLDAKIRTSVKWMIVLWTLTSHRRNLKSSKYTLIKDFIGCHLILKLMKVKSTKSEYIFVKV